MAANSMEQLASTRVICAIASEYFRGLTAVGLSGQMIITRSGPSSRLDQPRRQHGATDNLTGSEFCTVHRGHSFRLQGIPRPSVLPHRRGAVGSNLLHSRDRFGQQSAALSRVLRSRTATFGRASFCRVVEPLGPDWWTIQQVAQYLGIRQSTARARTSHARRCQHRTGTSAAPLFGGAPPSKSGRRADPESASRPSHLDGYEVQRLGPDAEGGAERGTRRCWFGDVLVVRLVAATALGGS
jgi:hypothetical protein